MIDIDMGRAGRAQALLEAMPPALYRSLPSAECTAEVCARVVSRALKSRNPRIVHEWLDYEKSTPAPDDLIACLDIALKSQLDLSGDRRTRQLADRIRVEAAKRLGLARVKSVSHHEKREDVIKGLLLAISSYDRRLYSHSLDVAAMAVRLAEAAQLETERVKHISQVSKVHEIGRLRLRDTDRSIAERFNADMRSEYRLRLADVRALEADAALVEVADTIYGVYVAEVLMASDEAHIIRLADAFVSMCEPRSYRKAFAPQDAFAEIWERRGKRFEARYVDLLLEVLGHRRSFARSA